MKTFILNEKNQAGGKSYKEFTWKEVLEWFGAPAELTDAEELAEWYQKENESAFDYIIEPWRDENGEIIAD